MLRYDVLVITWFIRLCLQVSMYVVYALFSVIPKSIWPHTTMMTETFVDLWSWAHIRLAYGQYYLLLNPSNVYHCNTWTIFRQTLDLTTRVNQKYLRHDILQTIPYHSKIKWTHNMHILLTPLTSMHFYTCFVSPTHGMEGVLIPHCRLGYIFLNLFSFSFRILFVNARGSDFSYGIP